MNAAALQDKLLIRELIERWAVWRDAGDWERFATLRAVQCGNPPQSL